MADLIKDIEGILQEEKNGQHVNHVTDRLIANGRIVKASRETAIKKVSSILSKKSRDKNSRICHVKNKNGTNKRGWYRYVQERKPRTSGSIALSSRSTIKALSLETADISSNMLGKAGEYAVVSRLLINGYIANIMSVDEGIDIIACKDQNVFFVQVKTSTIKQNLRCRFSIKKSAYQKGHLLQVRYLLVVRYGNNELLFIKLTEDDIKRLGNYISSEKNMINMNVKFENGKAYIYKGDKQDELDFFLNNFDL